LRLDLPGPAHASFEMAASGRHSASVRSESAASVNPPCRNKVKVSSSRGPSVRLFSRNAIDWTARLSAIAAAARRIKAKSFTIDGEAVVLGPDGLSLFDDPRRRNAAHIIYAFDLIEHDDADLRNLPFLDRKAALHSYCARPMLAFCSMSTSPKVALSSSRTRAGLAPRASSRRGSIAPIDPAPLVSGPKSAIRPASPCRRSGARCRTDKPEVRR
jgi:hypothetical protein